MSGNAYDPTGNVKTAHANALLHGPVYVKLKSVCAILVTVIKAS